MKKKLFLLSALTLFCTNLFFSGCLFASQKEYQLDDFASCSYSRGGDMLGGHFSISLRRDKKTKQFILSISEAHAHNLQAREKTFSDVPDELAQKILDLVNKYELTADKWANAPQSDMRVYDAASTSVSFSLYENEKKYPSHYRFGDYNKLPEADINVMGEICNIMLRYALDNGWTPPKPSYINYGKISS